MLTHGGEISPVSILLTTALLCRDELGATWDGILERQGTNPATQDEIGDLIHEVLHRAAAQVDKTDELNLAIGWLSLAPAELQAAMAESLLNLARKHSRLDAIRNPPAGSC